VLTGVAIHGIDADHDCGDVIQAAAAVRLRHHPVDPGLGIAVGAKNVQQLLVFQHSGQTVRRQQKDVAFFQRAEIDVGNHIDPCSHAPGDHVAVRMYPGLVRREQTGVDLLLDVGVILGELLKAAIAEEIRPAVSHLPDQIALWQQHQHGGGGTHAALVLLR
jgi:hypothetical protein